MVYNATAGEVRRLLYVHMYCGHVGTAPRYQLHSLSYAKVLIIICFALNFVS